MKTLEAGLIALQWQGGTIHQVINEISRLPCLIPTVWRWGYRDAKADPSIDISQFNIPINSWDRESDRECIVSFIQGLLDGKKRLGKL